MVLNCRLLHFTQPTGLNSLGLSSAAPLLSGANPGKARHYAPRVLQLVDRFDLGFALAVNTPWICGAARPQPPRWVLGSL